MGDQLVQPPRSVRLRSGMVVVGELAGTTVQHSLAPDMNTGSSCLACFGWADDPRHMFATPMATRGLGVRKGRRHA